MVRYSMIWCGKLDKVRVCSLFRALGCLMFCYGTVLLCFPFLFVVNVFFLGCCVTIVFFFGFYLFSLLPCVLCFVLHSFYLIPYVIVLHVAVFTYCLVFLCFPNSWYQFAGLE